VAGQNWWLVAFFVVMGFQFFLMWAYPTFISPLFNKFTPLEEGELKERVNTLLEKCQFQSDGLFVMDASIRSSHGNAYFTGLGKKKRIVSLILY
jgi:STE24 endopeptidase